ncbi:MAG: 3'(2'),5'-bisphosphate nucleotidase CysQ [Rhizobiales bacterium]|nr:3'(2'),5'-bisphosphate nucleotidase CysQ [Hyphomicrobiales bacterium]MBO6697591.1 3'(2'),5'-bisphosphate nucleotidase CysQ [Hyphomicrobiales bacterium]MBO6736154.1 3'(2'),5'-bisphosphate nucleotidase CysQ [Hyphomicrobiales bacterium]MBO6912624.1 3'(2'),5'-bisphosphate nucleotidase CysQ [Hyphomicrobiales bacterium]MBO6957178.1 3'(2'),5'-bisphosphate nucleotidase CysQ [Hyphomicrobiales bacterium]
MATGTQPRSTDWTQDRNALALALANLASQAGRAVMAIYADGFEVIGKEDGSPLTQADLAADEIVANGLRDLAPDIPVLSEESAETVDPDALGDLFFVVDPLDGTREFVEKNGEFSVNIALVEHGVPIVGVVYAPAHDKMWLAGDTAFAAKVHPGDAVDRDDIHAINTCPDPDTPIRAVASRSHRDPKTEAFLGKMSGCNTTAIGSALKFCLVAEGKADVYPRFGPTMVWDTAAGIAVLQAAGGVVLNEQDEPMRVRFGPEGWRNGAFTAWGCEKLKDRTDKNG